MEKADAVHSYLCPKENTVIILPEDEITHVGTASMGTKPMKPARGVVLAVGTTKAPGNGGQHAMDVRLGDLVIYTKGKGKEVKVDNDEYLLLDRDEILAVAD
ncbi:10 kDa chaperonin [Aspergillus udagawae]|uniref:10 kDa chaperonin n=1 Tax=Aspergillus udagawae TaxID=91492 RepID=A0A8H3PB59_9EURO|nr:10 kDa chaperonin [Aspergillus udagawae]GFF48845.1 10 kDa chaperonin [Aspergillus udagawae]GFF93849.1 10 kDa chaperonin [Aspergillus udagawae]GFG04737.1 10 kDa chaperonin [Aspergillus udagawae]GFG27029.1 10 kDa chaperonin [Aspergillus udagawae]